MNLSIHSMAGDTCLVDFERDGYGPANPDPEGFTHLLSTCAARELERALNLQRHGEQADSAGSWVDLSLGALD